MCVPLTSVYTREGGGGRRRDDGEALAGVPPAAFNYRRVAITSNPLKSVLREKKEERI